MPTRHFFKGTYAKPAPRHRQRRKRAPQIVVGQAKQADGKTKSRYMTAGQARQKQGNSKGGLTTHRRGLAHVWTSEEARAAALKSWRKKGRLNARTGARIGRKLRRIPQLTVNEKVLIRCRYSAYPEKGIRYDSTEKQWQRVTFARTVNIIRVISERQALRVLGYRPSPNGFIPEWTVVVPPSPNWGKLRGTKAAETGTKRT